MSVGDAPGPRRLTLFFSVLLLGIIKAGVVYVLSKPSTTELIICGSLYCCFQTGFELSYPPASASQVGGFIGRPIPPGPTFDFYNLNLVIHNFYYFVCIRVLPA